MLSEEDAPAASIDEMIRVARGIRQRGRHSGVVHLKQLLFGDVYVVVWPNARRGDLPPTGRGSPRGALLRRRRVGCLIDGCAN
jgi:hypothetical protein